jgi:glucose-1-phosphate thymidylyltransferase
VSGSAESIEAVVLAAGEGRRLRPLTERWPKTLLPIDGRPVLATLLRELAGAGMTQVTVVVGYLGDQVRRFLEDGGDFGVAVRVACQERPLGSADALREALAAGANAPLLVVAGDTVFQPGDLGRAAAAFLGSASAGGLGVRTVPAQELAQRSAVGVSGGRVVQVLEKPASGSAPTLLAGAPLWLLRAPVLAHIDDLPGPPFQLAEALQRTIDQGEEVLALPLGPTRDLTRPADVVLHNFPYLWSQVMQRGPEGPQPCKGEARAADAKGGREASAQRAHRKAAEGRDQGGDMRTKR